jgi:hypothetical protein
VDFPCLVIKAISVIKNIIICFFNKKNKITIIILYQQPLFLFYVGNSLFKDIAIVLNVGFKILFFF